MFKIKIYQKIFDTNGFTLKPEILTARQNTIFWLLVLLSTALKIYLIPFNMIDMGDNATRVWNALWWSQNPFFVLPESGHPLWFYFMGPLIKITGEIYYTPIISMIILMTIASIFIFRIALLISSYKTALLAFFITTLNPAIFRLNFQPSPQQTYLTALCILLYFLFKALFGQYPETGSEKSRKYFIIAGIFGFIALASRPDALFVIVPLAIFVSLSRKQGKWYFVIISIIFQVFWIALSYFKYGTLFRTLEAADQYTSPVDIHGLNLGLRLKGLFLPYYFLVLGLTIILFYYLIKGLIFSFKNYPKSVVIVLLINILAPALINGVAGMKSTIYHTTNYIYLMFFISPIFCAIGLNHDLIKIKQKSLQTALAGFIILSCIPLSYIKNFVPENNNKLFPKVIQFIVTADEPDETRKLIKFVDENIKQYPALIFDSEENASSIFYVPFRTKLAPPEKILITGYNVPVDKDGLQIEIDKFMKINTAGIIMTRKSPTVMNEIFTELLNNKPYKRNDLILAQETEKWKIYTYHQNNK